MKILFIIHDFLPDHQAGAEIYTYLLAKELSRRHEVCLFFTEIEPLAVSFKTNERIYNGLKCIEVVRPPKRNLLGRPFIDRKMEDIFLKTIETFKPDIIHFQHLLFHSLGYPRLARQKNIPTLFTLHDYWLTCPRWGQRLQANQEICHTVDRTTCARCLFDRPMNTSSFNLFSLLQTVLRKTNSSRNMQERVLALDNRHDQIIKLIEDVDLFIAPSPFLRRTFIEFGVPEEKIIFSDYGFDPSGFDKKTRKNARPIRFGFIGTINEHKGVHLLVEAFNKMPADKAELLIYGDLSWFPEYSKRVRKMAHSPAISFKGAISNNTVAHILSDIDVLVVPSIWFENSPLTIHEAFMSGVPVITSNIGGMADLVNDHVNGLLFNLNDPQSLSEAMMKIIQSEKLLDQLQRGIPPIKTIQEDAEGIEQLYLQLLGIKSF